MINIFKILSIFFGKKEPNRETPTELEPSKEDNNVRDDSYVALIERKKTLQNKWLSEMPQVLAEHQNKYQHIYQKYPETPERYQMHNYIFEFFDTSKVLVLNGEEINYDKIKSVNIEERREFGPNHNWEDANLSLVITLAESEYPDHHIVVYFDPYDVLFSIYQKLNAITAANG